MTLQEIKQAVDNGEIVYYVNASTLVCKDDLGRYLLLSDNGYCTELTEHSGFADLFYRA